VTGLDQDLAWLFAPAGPAADLQQRLEQLLGRPEVNAEQAAVGVNNDDQSHTRKIVSFGQHLGAYQDAGLAGVYGIEDHLNAALALSAVPVDPDDRCFGKGGGQDVFGSFGSLTNGLKGLTVALGAVLGGRCLIVAVVAAHGAVPAMVGQAGVTAWALHHVTAVETHHDRGKPSAIDKDQCLLAPVESLPDGVDGGLGYASFKRSAADVEQA